MNKTSQNLINDFYINGYHRINFEMGTAKRKFDSLIETLDDQDLNENPMFVSSYDNTFDLKKIGCDEVEIIKNFVQEQQIGRIVNEVTGHSYLLSDLILRKTYSRKKSYMNMHRDSYFDKNGNQVGRFPALVKVIVYPKISGSQHSEPCLLIKPGSHRRMWKNFYIDKAMSLTVRNMPVYNDKNSAILFDTSVYHHACTTSNKNGAFRLILNFCVPDQIKSFKVTKEYQDFING